MSVSKTICGLSINTLNHLQHSSYLNLSIAKLELISALDKESRLITRYPDEAMVVIGRSYPLPTIVNWEMSLTAKVANHHQFNSFKSLAELKSWIRLNMSYSSGDLSLLRIRMTPFYDTEVETEYIVSLDDDSRICLINMVTKEVIDQTKWVQLYTDFILNDLVEYWHEQTAEDSAAGE